MYCALKEGDFVSHVIKIIDRAHSTGKVSVYFVQRGRTWLVTNAITLLYTHLLYILHYLHRASDILLPMFILFKGVVSNCMN